MDNPTNAPTAIYQQNVSIWRENSNPLRKCVITLKLMIVKSTLVSVEEVAKKSSQT